MGHTGSMEPGFVIPMFQSPHHVQSIYFSTPEKTNYAHNFMFPRSIWFVKLPFFPTQVKNTMRQRKVSSAWQCMAVHILKKMDMEDPCGWTFLFWFIKELPLNEASKIHSTTQMKLTQRGCQMASFDTQIVSCLFNLMAKQTFMSIEDIEEYIPTVKG